MDAWGADIVVSASQKSPDVPARAGLCRGQREGMGDGRSATAPCRASSADFRRAKASLDKGETPFTPPVSLVYGLREALRMIDEEGLANVLARHRRLSSALRAGCQALGLELYNRAAVASTTVVGDQRAARARGHGDRRAPARALPHRDRRLAQPGLHNKVIRIGTMGAVSEADIQTDLAHLEATLKDLGTAVRPRMREYARRSTPSPSRRA